MVNAGELRHPAKFVSPTVTTTGGDTTLDPRIESFESRVKVEPVGGLESTVADQVQASRISMVTMRYDARVNQRMQLLLQNLKTYAWDRTFEIMSILNLGEQNRELQLTCRELV